MTFKDLKNGLEDFDVLDNPDPFQEMVIDEAEGKKFPRYLVYDVILFEGQGGDSVSVAIFEDICTPLV